MEGICMEPAQIRAQIVRIPLFHGLPELLGKHAVNVLSRICEVRTTGPGATLFTEGSYLRLGYILRRGEVAVRKKGSPELRLAAPDLLGEMKQFSPVGQRTATVEACGELEVLDFKWSDFHRDIAGHLDESQQKRLADAIENYA